jgi:tetratricopeptide (TPR) repeat protein
MDITVDPTKVETLSKIEGKAIYAIQVEDWELAEARYEELLQFARGWLAQGDPNVLWMQTHLTEALVKLGKIDLANKIHQELLDRIAPPDTDDEKDILNEVLHLQIEIVNKLLARRRRKDALAILRDALEVSIEGLGRRNETTGSIRESHNRVLERDQKSIQKRLDRLKGKQGGHHVRRDMTVPTTETLVAAIHIDRAGSETPTHAEEITPETRLTSSLPDIYDNLALGFGINVVDDTSEYTPQCLFRRSHLQFKASKQRSLGKESFLHNCPKGICGLLLSEDGQSNRRARGLTFLRGHSSLKLVKAQANP